MPRNLSVDACAPSTLASIKATCPDGVRAGLFLPVIVSGGESMMPALSAAVLSSRLQIRAAQPADIDALMDLEQQIFSTDRLSRRSLRHFLHSPTASVIVAEESSRLA